MVTLKRNFFLMVSFFVTPLVMTYPDFNDFFSRSIIGGTTEYEVISDNHVRSYTNSGNSVFVTTDTFDVLDKNTASWQWKVLIPLEANERLRRNHDFAARIIFCKSDGILPTQKDVLIMFGQIQLKKERYGLIPGTQNRSILHLEIVKMGSILGKKKRLTL